MNKVLHRKLLTFTHNAIIWFRIVFRNGKSTVVITRLKKNHLIVSQKICSISWLYVVAIMCRLRSGELWRPLLCSRN